RNPTFTTARTPDVTDATAFPARKAPAAVLRHPAMKHLLLVSCAAVMFYPLAWMTAASLRPSAMINEYSLWPGEAFTLQNYVDGWRGLGGVPFARFFVNSLLISILSVIGNVISCAMAAYAFAR